MNKMQPIPWFSQKTSKHILLYCLTLLVLMGIPRNTLAKDKFTWFTMGWPPVFFQDGEHKNQGHGDYLIRRLTKSMPEFDHDIVEANIKRVFKSLKEGDHACFPAAMRTSERDKYLYFSAYIWLPPLHLIFNKSRADILHFNENKPLTFAKLIKEDHVTGILTTHRSFSESIDATIMKNTKKSNITKITMTPGTNWAPLNMVASGRSDYTIEYPWAIPVFFSLTQWSQKSLTPIPMTELPRGFIGYIAVPRTKWGALRVQEIDAAIRKMAGEPGYRRAMEKWQHITPGSSFQLESEAFYNERARRSWHSLNETKP